jgi:hypothetical protein
MNSGAFAGSAGPERGGHLYTPPQYSQMLCQLRAVSKLVVGLTPESEVLECLKLYEQKVKLPDLLTALLSARPGRRLPRPRPLGMQVGGVQWNRVLILFCARSHDRQSHSAAAARTSSAPGVTAACLARSC